MEKIRWRVPKPSVSVDPRVVANPHQARDLLDAVSYVGGYRRARGRRLGETRVVSLPPHLVALWRDHIATFGTADDGRLFFTEQGRIITYTTYNRVWHETRALALSPALASTPLAKRPYDLRHSTLSTWLCAGADPAEVAQRAGNSVEVLLSRYAKCLYDRRSMNNPRIEGLLSAYDQPPDLDQ